MSKREMVLDSERCELIFPGKQDADGVGVIPGTYARCPNRAVAVMAHKQMPRRYRACSNHKRKLESQGFTQVGDGLASTGKGAR